MKFLFHIFIIWLLYYVIIISYFKEKAASIKIPTFDESEIVKIYESKVGSSPNLASQF